MVLEILDIKNCSSNSRDIITTTPGFNRISEASCIRSGDRFFGLFADIRITTVRNCGRQGEGDKQFERVTLECTNYNCDYNTAKSIIRR